MINEFVLGAMAGGITIAITNPNALWTNKKQNQMKQAVLEGKGDMVAGVFGDMLDRGEFGPKDITNNNKAIFGDPKIYDVKGKKMTYDEIIKGNPALVNDEVFEEVIGAKAPLPGELSINTMGYKAAMQDLAKAEIIVKKMGIYDTEVMNELMSNSEGKELLSEAYDNVIATKEKTDQIEAKKALITDNMSEDEISGINKEIKALEAERESLNLQLEDIRTGNRFRDDAVRMISSFVGRSNNKKWIGPDGQPSVMDPITLKNSNAEYDTLRKLAIEKAQENRSLKEDLDKDIDILRSIKSPHAETEQERAKGYEDILNRVDGIRSRVKNLGASEAAMDEALENLSKIRNDIIDNIPSYLTGPELEEARKSAGFELAPEEVLGEKTKDGKYIYVSAGEALDFAKKVEDTIDDFDEVPDKPSIMNKDGKTPSKRKYNALKNKIEKGIDLDSVEMAEWEQYMELGDPNFSATTMDPVVKPYKNRYKGFDELGYDESTFKQNFWMTYYDENGNSMSILDEISSLKKRGVLEKEDAARINNIRDAIQNQDYKLTAMKKGLQDMLIKGGEYRMGDYVPSQHAAISDDDFIKITKAIRETALSLLEVEIQYERDINSISNRNDRFRFNTSRIKKDILEMIRVTEYFVVSEEDDALLASHSLNIDKKIQAIKENYVSTSTYDNTTSK